MVPFPHNANPYQAPSCRPYIARNSPPSQLHHYVVAAAHPSKEHNVINFTNTIQINRPIEDVYAYLSDLTHTPEWNWAIQETRQITPGPTAVGTRYRQTRNVPRPATEVLEITNLETDRHIELEGTLAQFSAHLSYQLDATERGTQITNAVALDPQGAVRLFAPVAGSRIKRAVADNLSQLKNLLETEFPITGLARSTDGSPGSDAP
jgi:uncharacterized membrane protein